MTNAEILFTDVSSVEEDRIVAQNICSFAEDDFDNAMCAEVRKAYDCGYVAKNYTAKPLPENIEVFTIPSTKQVITEIYNSVWLKAYQKGLEQRELDDEDCVDDDDEEVYDDTDDDVDTLQEDPVKEGTDAEYDDTCDRIEYDK